MRSRMLGLTLIALLAASAVAAAGASASAWRLNGFELTTATSVTATGTVELEHRTLGMRISCPVSQEGTVGPGKVGTITGKAVVTCTRVSGEYCESAIELERRHLPWSTELVTVNGLQRNKISTGGSGTPEWWIRCNAGAVKHELFCTGAETTTSMTNLSETVKAAFDEESSRGSCNVGAEKQLVITGSGIIKPVAGGTLRVANPEWLINGAFVEPAVTTIAKGALKLIDTNAPGGKRVVECATEGEEAVGPRTRGEVKAPLSLTSCKFVEKGSCESLVSTTPKGLPWRTSLATNEGATRELITEDGGGLPGFEVTCKTILGNVTDTCTGNTSALVKVVTGGVDETFDSQSETLSCSQGGLHGKIEGTRLINNPTNGTLTFTPF
jgi:hypothetical protein